MPKLVILGTSHAVPDENHENTHMAVVGDSRMVLIDGAGNPQVRMKKAGLDDERLTDVVMTHLHPDHVSGIPLLLMGMGLSRREKPLNIFAIEHCMEPMKKMLEWYEWDTWHFFPVHFHTLPEEPLHLVIDCDEFRMLTSPVKHFIPTVGVRIEFKKTGRVFAYSCDTAPTPTLADLARDADVFIHEAAGASVGHSSAAQAGEIARQAKAKTLYLIHYPTGGYNYQKLAEEAEQTFGGPVIITEDFMEIDLS
jgi:ribonuclease Z